MRFVKIRFTAWGDRRKSASWSHHAPDASTAREKVLRGAVRRLRKLQIQAKSEILHMALNALARELGNIHAARQRIAARKTTAVQLKDLVDPHKKVGTYGYQVLNPVGSQVLKIVDQSGKDLPADAMYAFEVSDDDPPLPDWAKKASIGY